jgi:hypothetical protein
MVAIETINGKPLTHYRRVYHAAGRGNIGFYAAFVEICQTELNEMQKAVATAPSLAERKVVEEDYQSRKLFFELEQAAHDPAEVAVAKLAAHNVSIKGKSHSKRPAYRHIDHAAVKRTHR